MANDPMQLDDEEMVVGLISMRAKHADGILHIYGEEIPVKVRVQHATEDPDARTNRIIHRLMKTSLIFMWILVILVFLVILL